jgi:predicted transposase/invertase (TIGR01784 family)
MEKKVFAPITLDTIFKIVFTKEKNKKSLLFLLNTCLKEVLKEPIADATIIQTVEPPESKDGKFTVFDMQCRDGAGARFIVEMQVGKQKYFIKRTFFCLCRAVSNLVERGKIEVEGKEMPYDYNIPVVYTLSFLNFDVDFGENCDEVVQYLSICNDLHPETRYDMMHMVYVLFPRFNKGEQDCQDALDQLIFTFKKAHTLSEKPASFKDEALIEIFESAKISNLNMEELMDYERRMKYISDTSAAMDYAREEGEALGMKKIFSLWESGVPLPEAKQMLGLKS